MASSYEVNARADALLLAPNNPAFHHGVTMLRCALANGGPAVFNGEVRDCAMGLLAGTSDYDTQAGIAALAQMLGVVIDLLGYRRRIEVLEEQRYSLELPASRVVLIEADGREVAR